MNRFEAVWQHNCQRAKILWRLFPRQAPSFMCRVLIPAFVLGLITGVVGFVVCFYLNCEHDTFLIVTGTSFIFGFGSSGTALLPSFVRLDVERHNKSWELFSKQYPHEALLLENPGYARQVFATTMFFTYND